MSYKNVQHYRHTVHRYLDAIWIIGVHKYKARSFLYKWLAFRMGIPKEEAHVRYFTRAQCKEAIKILRPMYIQLYGRDINYKKSNKNLNKGDLEKMYYSSKTIEVYLMYNAQENKGSRSCWCISIYCKTRALDENGKVYNFSNINVDIVQKLEAINLDEIFDFKITPENVAKWIWEQIVPCYKVEIETEENENVVFVEQED